MPPERFLRQCPREFAEESSLPLQRESAKSKTGGIRGEFESRARSKIVCYNKDLCWLGRQDSNLGSRDQSPLPYRLATPQHAQSGACIAGAKATA